jgi:hypothetical protein
MMWRQIICICLFILVYHNDHARSFDIAISQNHISATDRLYSGIKGGDTLLLKAGLRDALQFSDIHGQAGSYIVIINDAGLCDIHNTLLSYGISFRNCSYIKLCGGGSRDHTYGIKIAEVSLPGAGLGISFRTDNIEICNIEICHTNGPGILCKTEPDCNTSASNYTQYNTSIHHNYIHHTGTEGMYIGSSAFEGVKVSFDTAQYLRMPPTLCYLDIYDNIVEYTGWDGIQVCYSAHVRCYSNIIRYDSQKDENWQNTGLIIGGGTSGEFYGNTIEHGKGYGINCFGRGRVLIRGNRVRMDNAPQRCALYLSDKLADRDTRYVVVNNSFETNYMPYIKSSNGKYNAAILIRGNTVKPLTN